VVGTATALLPGHLGRRVLQGHPVGTQLQVGLAGLQHLALRVVEVGEEDLLGEGQRTIQAAPHRLEVLLHPLVDAAEQFRGRFNGGHGDSSLV